MHKKSNIDLYLIDNVCSISHLEQLSTNDSLVIIINKLRVYQIPGSPKFHMNYGELGHF